MNDNMYGKYEEHYYGKKEQIEQQEESKETKRILEKFKREVIRYDNIQRNKEA